MSSRSAPIRPRCTPFSRNGRGTRWPSRSISSAISTGTRTFSSSVGRWSPRANTFPASALLSSATILPIMHIEVMADLSVTKADPPAQEGTVPDICQLHIVDSTKDNHICLSDLHQVYIDRIAKYLDLKEIVRLQLTCRGLFKKGFRAQRLISQRLDVEIRPHTPTDARYRYLGEDISVSYSYNRFLTEKQLLATNCRFHVDVYVRGLFTPEDIRKIAEVLGGRGTIKRLYFFHVSPEMDRNIFNEFLQDFDVSELHVEEMPQDFLQLPSVMQLKCLEIDAFPLSLVYLLDTTIHTCFTSLNRNRPEHRESAEMHEILEKWGRNQKFIESYRIFNFNCDEAALFFGWRIVDSGEVIPPERPIVIRYNRIRDAYRVIRRDGTCLFVRPRGRLMKVDVVGFRH